MAATSLFDVRDDVQAIAAGARTAAADLDAILAAGSATTQQVRNLRATIAGLDGDARTVRASLDDTDVRDLLSHERAEDVIALWRWERGTRHALIVVERRLQEADDVAELLELGTRDRTYVVRTGDTWQGIAAQLLGDWQEWPRLVQANGGDPGALTRGTVLFIPE